MFGKTFLLAFLLVAVTSQDVPHRQRRFLSRLSSPTTFGFQGITNMVTGGVRTAADAVGTVASTAKQQTAYLVNTGKQITQSAVQQISLPAINAATSVIVSKFNFLSRTTGNDVVVLPALDTSLMGFGTLKTSNGTLKRLSTMERDGAINVTAGLTSMRISIPLKFNELSVSFDKYAFTTWGIDISGDLKATIKENSFVAHIVLQPGLTCQVNVEKVEVRKSADWTYK